MANYTKINKEWWDTITPIHAKSRLYNLSAFKKGKTSLQELEQKELGNVKGKTMLHLLCHFGMDSLSWAKKGAVVTGVDISSTAIDLAKKLSEETDIPATFICSDVYTLPKILHKKFDIIFMSYGVVLWLKNLEKWAEILNRYLKKNGIVYIVDIHPFTNILSYDGKLSYDYFDKGPFLDDADGSYTDWNKKIDGVTNITYEWSYTISDIMNALIESGLTIEFLHEFPYTMYNQFPGLMKKNKKGQYILKDKNVKIPLLFSLKAHK